MSETKASQDGVVVTETASIATKLSVLGQIRQHVKGHFWEREEVIDAMIVALLARQHIVVIGEPGTGKTDLMKYLSECFLDNSGTGLSRFACQLNAFTLPDQLFGPVSVSALKNDMFRRVTTKRLPEAELALLDEVFKATTVLNTLLELMNERVYDNGSQLLNSPLMTMIGSSNEMPAAGEQLDALWDRFLLRTEVEYLQDDGNFESLLKSRAVSNPTAQQPTVTMSKTALISLQQDVVKVPIPQTIISALVKLRRDLKQTAGIVASDRRWVQVLRAMQASAFMNARTVVDEDDFEVLKFILWKKPADRAEVKKMVGKLANPIFAKAAELKDSIIKAWSQASQDLKGLDPVNDSDKRSAIALSALSKANGTEKQLKSLIDQLNQAGKPTSRVDQALKAVKEIQQQILSNV